jgi:hypothetical protein
MQPLKTAIFKELRATTNKVDAFTDEQLNDVMFHHSDSLRLSYGGYLWMGKMFTAYQFPVPNTLKSKHQIGLSKMEYPYYITPNRLVLFSDTDAMVVKLAGGIERFLEINFQIDR